MATNRIKLLDLEREHILSTLRQCRGNRTHTARSLGISVRGLRIKLASYAEMGADVPPPAAHSIAALGKAVPRDSAGRRCVERTLRPPNLDNHVCSQLGLSLRIFYDAILCSPLPEAMKALAADLDERSPA
jgi:regulatory Fis family protein